MEPLVLPERASDFSRITPPERIEIPFLLELMAAEGHCDDGYQDLKRLGPFWKAWREWKGSCYASQDFSPRQKKMCDLKKDCCPMSWLYRNGGHFTSTMVYNSNSDFQLWRGAIVMDKYKTKEQLVKELAELRQRITKSEKSEVELKRAEEKLRESENGFRAIANYTCDCESWIDPEGKLIWVNPAVFELTGYTVDECMVMADYPLALIDEKDRSKIAGYLGEAIRGSSGKNVEFRLRCKDGSLKWGAVSWQPIYDDHGSSLGVRSSVRDITDRKQAGEALIASEEKYRRFFEDAILGYFSPRLRERSLRSIRPTPACLATHLRPNLRQPYGT